MLVASLMENLIQLLEKENNAYEELVELSNRKTPSIIHKNLEELNAITDEEQIIVGRILQIEKSREGTLKDIAEVINKDVESLKLSELVQLLDNRPEEQRALAKIHDKLRQTMGNMVTINERNKTLINDAMELIQFDMNLLQSMNTAPQNANYNRSASNEGDFMGRKPGAFDAKQ